MLLSIIFATFNATVVDATTLTVVLSDGTEETVTVDALPANEETTVTVTANGADHDVTVTYEVTELTSAIESVVAITNNLVEITLEDAVDAVDASMFSIVDADGEELEITGATLSSEKVIYVETADQTAGELYTLTTGDVTVNFGGIAEDTTAPKVTGVTSDYLTIQVTFNEKVDVSGATFELAEKYGSKDALEVTNIETNAANTVVTLTTEAQEANTRVLMLM